MRIAGIPLLGLDAGTGHRVALSVAALAVLAAIRYGSVWVMRIAFGPPKERTVFWTRQGVALVTMVAAVLFLVSIWFDSSARLGTFAGFIGAGLAFALQKVVTAFAGYLVILRGRTFTVGDRITMGGIRGDVIQLGFLQTRIMEMGETDAAQPSDNPSWIRARQYTGRIVTVTNDKVFDQPIYNYTHEFPFMWEELVLPVPYRSDRGRAESILVDCAKASTASFAPALESARQKLQARYFIDLDALGPRVYYELTDNWIALHLRFMAPVRGVRAIKDEIQRAIVKRFEEAGLSVASGTYDIVGLPPIRLEVPGGTGSGGPAARERVREAVPRI